MFSAKPGWRQSMISSPLPRICPMTAWPLRSMDPRSGRAPKDLRRLGETRMASTPSQAKHILERVADAMSHTADGVCSYLKEHPEFVEIGDRMLQEWEQGRELSLN